MANLQSNSVTVVDQTDNRKFEIYIKSNMPTAQIFNQNTGTYSPDWSSGLELTADVYLESREMDSYNGVSFKWTVDDEEESVSTSRTYKITNNVLSSKPILTYVCVASYQNLTATSKITFTRTDTGLNGVNGKDGADGKDGTSVRILGTAVATPSTDKPGYYEINYQDGAITAAALGDGYIGGDGHLYVCVVLNDDTTKKDYFLDVGNIQGPKGKDGVDAQLITLNSSSQVFKANNAGTITPATITVNATAINTSVSEWTYSTDGGPFSTTVPTGVSRNGDTVTITGANLSVSSVVLKASDGTNHDTLTIYKVVDGANGNPASMAFLTNENISFAANANGQVASTSITINVVAYRGTEKVMPTVGTPTGMPNGMTISVDSTSLASSSKEARLTISIAENSKLGPASSNHGTIAVPITSPVNTNLLLSWSKINAGPQGEEGVGINSVEVKYGTTTTITGNPESDITWGGTMPTVADGNYLWTRTRIDYTDPTRDDTVTYTYAKQGKQGESGTSVSVVKIQYRAHNSATTPPTTWSTSVEATSATNPYLWTRTTFSDGKYADSVARYGLDGASGADAYTVLLTNESHVFAGNTSSAVAGSAETQVLAYKGTAAQTVTIVSVNGVAASTVSANTGIAGLTFACSAISGTSPKITFYCTTSFVSPNGSIPIVLSVGGVSFTKIFTYSIAFKGNTGGAGSAATAYRLISSASVVHKTTSGSVILTPSTLTFTGKSKTGTSAPADYSCRWIIAYSTDGSTYTDSYTSSADEASKTFTVDATYQSIRVRMYLAGGTSALLDEQIIPVVSDGVVGTPGMNAVTFQIYSNNGYALSTNTPNVTLQTFAYIGDVAITADATYQWYAYGDTGWTAISGETSAYLTITREDVVFSKSYMCKMMFDGAEYTGVATIDDKNDENKVFTTKPSNYTAGDMWIVGVDYAPAGIEVGTLLKAEHTNSTYEDADWVTSLKYDDKIVALENNMKTYNQYFSFDSTDGLKISAKDDNGTPSQFSTSLTNERLSFNYGNEAIAYINGTKMNIKEAEIESPLTVTGKYSGSTMLQAPVINIGNFSIIVESNGSLSIVANT